jgi:predicted transcriptional regulator
MPLHLTPELEHRLEQLAARTERTPEELAQEALDRFVSEQEEILAAIQEGDNDIASGNVLPHEEVVARFQKRQWIAAVEEGRAAAQRGDLIDHEAVMTMMDDIIENG